MLSWKPKCSDWGILPLVGLFLIGWQLDPNHLYATSLRGENCGAYRCADLLKTLENEWSVYVQRFRAQCRGDRFLSLNLWQEKSAVGLICWESQVATGGFGGQRSGYFLGALPYPNKEAEFPVAVKSDDSKIQAVLAKHPTTVQQFAFDCATYYGDVDFELSGSWLKRLNIGCYSTGAGAELVDTDGDWISDGENSRGASVMYFVRTIYFLDFAP